MKTKRICCIEDNVSAFHACRFAGLTSYHNCVHGFALEAERIKTQVEDASCGSYCMELFKQVALSNTLKRNHFSGYQEEENKKQEMDGGKVVCFKKTKHTNEVKHNNEGTSGFRNFSTKCRNLVLRTCDHRIVVNSLLFFATHFHCQEFQVNIGQASNCWNQNSTTEILNNIFWKAQSDYCEKGRQKRTNAPWKATSDWTNSRIRSDMYRIKTSKLITWITTQNF